LQGGEVIPLTGALGAGKTTFIRGMARGLRVEDPDEVRSPSYTLVIRYPGPKPLLHLDAYFMKHSEDLYLCGMEDALAARDVVVIEWGDRVEDHLPEVAWAIEITRLSPESRTFRFRKGRGGKKQ
jgi:tRNA threonylcarbamoyladenosine biosynthesis protein TsaE